MDAISILTLAGIVGGGLLAMILYVLAASLREMSRQLTKTNDLLILAWRSGQGDEFASRALVAKAAGLTSAEKKAPPQKPEKLKGVAEKKPAFELKMGSR